MSVDVHEGAVRDSVLSAINTIADPCSVAAHVPAGLADMGLVVNCDVRGDPSEHYDVNLAMRVTSPGCLFFGVFDSEIRKRVAALPQVRSVSVEWAMEPMWEPSMMSPDLRERRIRLLSITSRQTAAAGESDSREH